MKEYENIEKEIADRKEKLEQNIKALEKEKFEAIKEAILQKKPIPKEDIDWSVLLQTCKNYIDDLAKQGWADDDYPYYIEETAMIAIYGKDVFDWVNAAREHLGVRQ